MKGFDVLKDLLGDGTIFGGLEMWCWSTSL